MKKNNTRLLLIVALLIVLVAASVGIARSNKTKTEGQKKQTAEAITEQTEQQAEEEVALLRRFSLPRITSLKRASMHRQTH